jgi:hypothetical protein
VTFRAPASAQANDVLAHPGGPYSKTPGKKCHGHMVNNRLLSHIQNINLNFYSKTNEMNQFFKFILFCSSTLHVSDGLSVHRQESKTVMMDRKTVRNM